MEPTIVQNGALFQVHQSKRTDLKLAVRFYKKHLRQIKRDARRKRIELAWLKFREAFRSKNNQQKKPS